MANAKPYYTTDDLIASIKRRISFPLSQNTFQYSDLVAFLNEEMQLSAVPSVKMEHEEYFVYKVSVPLVNGVSRYEIPNRAIGMALRDVKYSDSSGNFYDMSRIAPDDKAFFQQSNGSNQTISKYYIEGNEIVLTPLVQAGAVGKLNFFIYLRPNSLVRNDRAATIQSFQKDVTISNNANLEVGDSIYIYTGTNTSPTPEQYIFTASNKAVSTVSTTGLVTVATPHLVKVGESTTLTLLNVSSVTPEPSVNGSYVAVATSSTQFQLSGFPTGILTPRTGGTYIFPYEFQIGATSNSTAAYLNTAINVANIKGISSNVLTNVVTVTYLDIATTFESIKKKNPSLGNAFAIDSTNLYVKFDHLPTTYTDPETMETGIPLYGVGHLVDFLQTNPGHRTYTYDIPIANIIGNVGVFAVSDLQTYLNNSSGGTLAFYNIKVGDYICLANECIIPQIPPELHNALAERAASRILMAIGDVQGYQVSQAKLAEMNKMQETLIGSRIEGSVPKVFNRYSLLRLGKSRFRRRY
jgi:hypothetical protein